MYYLFGAILFNVEHQQEHMLCRFIISKRYVPMADYLLIINRNPNHKPKV